MTGDVQYCVSLKEERGLRSQAREFLCSSMFAMESSKRVVATVPILDRGTGTKLEGSDLAP